MRPQPAREQQALASEKEEATVSTALPVRSKAQHRTAANAVLHLLRRT
jgi:hypothetical protein